MRKFLLQNEDGQNISLMGRMSVTPPNGGTPKLLGAVMATSPAGLGFEEDYTFGETDGFFIQTNRKARQTAKTATLVFTPPNAYTNYKTFVDFVAQSDKLTLVYCPKNTWYYVDVAINSISKGELTGTRCLECAVSMLPISPFYLPTEMNIILSGDLGDSIKQYSEKMQGSGDDRYSYTYEINREVFGSYIDDNSDVGYLGKSTSIITDGGSQTPTIPGWSGPVNDGYYVWYNGGYFVMGLDNKWHSVTITDDDYYYTYSNTATAGEIEFDINAQMDSGLEIVIPGPISAPKLLFYADGKQQIGQIDLTSVSAESGEYIRYSSVPTSAGIYKGVGTYPNGVETDITMNIGLDPEYPTFFMLPTNKTIKAVLQADVITGTNAALKVYEYFRSV